MFSLLNIIAPSVIFWVAIKEYPEFFEYRGREYPGKEGPRKMKIEPERPAMFRDLITTKEKKRTFRFSYLKKRKVKKKKKDISSVKSKVWVITPYVVEMPEIEIA